MRQNHIHTNIEDQETNLDPPTAQTPYDPSLEKVIESSHGLSMKVTNSQRCTG